MLGCLLGGVVLLGLLTGCGPDHPHYVDMPVGGESSIVPGGGEGGTGADPGKEPGKEPEKTPPTEGGLIELPAVVDIAYDGPRNKLYASTTGGGLAMIDLETGEIETMGLSDNPLRAIDLSPDGQFLVVAEAGLNDMKQFVIHLVDLEAEDGPVSETILFNRYSASSLQDGSYSVAFVDSASVLMTSSYPPSGYVPFIHLDLRDKTIKSLADINSHTALARSFDGSSIAWVEGILPDAPFGVVNASTLKTKRSTVQFGRPAGPKYEGFDVAVNVDGTKLAFPMTGSIETFAFDGTAFTLKKAVLEADRRAMAAVYSPVSNSLFGVWSADAVSKSPGFIARYDASSLEVIERVNQNVGLADTRVGGFLPVRARISDDGTLLFVTVTKGINVYKIDP
jgi:hypothetical protein